MRRPGEMAWVRPALGVAAVSLSLLGLTACAGAKGKQADGGVDGMKVTSVAVYPLAGTPDASEKSEISFRGVEPAELSGLVVIGSKTGRHTGTLQRHSDGLGASFVPRKHFAAGETVRVRAAVPLIGERKGVVRFRIAQRPGSVGKENSFPDGSKPGIAGTNHYISRPDLHPPQAKIAVSRPSASSDDIFLAPKSGPSQSGPLILDSQGRTVWFHPLQRGYKAYDFRAQTYRGEPVLTWWQGKAAGEYGGGKGIIIDSSYRVIASVRGGNGYPVDIHEFRLTPNGTALVLAYRAVRWDLRPLHGPRDRALVDSIAMEIDVKTGRVLFEWHSLGHIPLRDSYARFNPKTRGPVDYTHLNSVALDEDGNFLISARNTWAVYKVDRRTGRILWQLGGKRSTFRLPKYARFVGQHDFERTPDGRYTLFDNGNVIPPPKWVSRGLVFAIDPGSRSARLVQVFRQPQGRGSTTQGSVQTRPDGHYVIGWGGGISDFSEFSSDRRLLFDAHLMVQAASYRVYRGLWKGQPKRGPDIKVLRKKGRTVAFVSWNGATDVSEWQVLAGNSQDSLKVVAHAKRRGFETAVPLPSSARFVAAEAVSDAGTVLAGSKTVRPVRG